MCTLMLPCAHFFREESLKKFLKRAMATDVASQKAMGPKKLVNSLGIKKIDHRAVVLMETGLNNRNTDRTADIFHRYHKREKDLNDEAIRIEDKRLKKAQAIENGTWMQWREEVMEPQLVKL